MRVDPASEPRLDVSEVGAGIEIKISNPLLTTNLRAAAAKSKLAEDEALSHLRATVDQKEAINKLKAKRVEDAAACAVDTDSAINKLNYDGEVNKNLAALYLKRDEKRSKVKAEIAAAEALKLEINDKDFTASIDGMKDTLHSSFLLT